jgi:hypothetical protein
MWLEPTTAAGGEKPIDIDGIPSTPKHGVYISQVIQYANACSTYVKILVFILRQTLNKFMLQGFLRSRLQVAFYKIYGHY